MRLRQLATFLGLRILALIGVMLGMSLLVFCLLYLAPGSAIDVLLGSRPRDPALVASLTQQYGLNDPFWVQYLRWLGKAVRLDFGDSIANQAPVTTVIGRGLAVTVPLGLMAFVFTMVSGVALGVLAALRKQRLLDRGVVAVSIIGISAPAFATGLFLLYLFGVVLGWFPVFGTGTGFGDRLYHLVLPAVALALTGTAFVVKLTRTAMISALGQDYVVFARARGKSRTAVIGEALRNALVPVVTSGGIVLGGLLTGTVVIEVTFSLPGLGQLLVDSVTAKDIPVVQALAVLSGGIIVLANLLADLLYLIVDPRMRSTAKGGGR